jgi:AraC family transcriptional regulator
VSGQTISNLTVETSVGRIEIFRRANPGPSLNWDFCQPELTLFWHREGFKRMQGRIAGAPVDLRFIGGSNLSIFAPATEIHTIFDTQEHCDYVAAFFSRDSLNCRGLELDQSRIAFYNEAIQRSLAEICREAEEPDDLFELYAEGWAIQMLARIAKLARTGADVRAAHKGGLPARTLKKIEIYVRENIASSISLDQLAGVALVSKRHFLRAFSESVGVTPHRFVMGIRIDEAKARLRSTSDSITEIGLSCGFLQPQHFSTTFRKLTGHTPLRYRQNC